MARTRLYRAERPSHPPGSIVRTGDAVVSHPGRRRAATLACALAVILSVLAAIAPQGRAGTPTVLLGRNRVGEFQGVRGERFLAWQQNTMGNPDQYDVFARPIDGGKSFKVNAEGSNGANGDIEGDLLVYQQFEGGSSDLKFFDLENRERSSPPGGVNTPQWEYWPSLSQDRLLFGRLSGNGVRRIVLFDTSTGSSSILAKVRGQGFLAPGQINGDWAAWYRCLPSGTCDVIRYHIPDGAKETIPNPARDQHSPSVGPDGTVYFARARGACGSGVRLISYPLGGPDTELVLLPGRYDIGSTHFYMDPDGESTLYFDHYACDQAAVSDVWEIVEQGSSPDLSVTVGGDGDGTVTSSPAGINCPSDCTEPYDPSTDVTLTATPDGTSIFAGWSGAACTSNPTPEQCVVTMDADKTVIATFDLGP